MNSVLKYLYHKTINGTDRWYPLLSVYYLTYECKFRCPYCCDGNGVPYYSLDNRPLDGEGAISLLGKIRDHCDYVVITGGEPLEHRSFTHVMNHVGGLKFKEVVLTTNGYDIEPHLQEISRGIDSLVFSIDTLDHKKADSWFGQGDGAFKKILGNIESAAHFPGRRYKITISAVITPENIVDIYDVYRYSRQRGFSFAACPQLMGIKAHDSLSGDKKYRELFDYLIREKKKGADIFGTVQYLRYMRDLRKFDCHPFTMLVVSPEGKVFYPCLEIGNYAGNLLENNDLHSLRKKGLGWYGPQPECDTRCHSACALSFAVILNHPFVIAYESYLMGKRWVKAILNVS